MTIKKRRTSRKETPLRREEIVRCLEAENSLTYKQIQQRFAVAPMTARRDVAALDAEGRAVKVLRGAMKISPDGILSEGPLHLRLRKNITAKRLIAQRAMGLIVAGNTLYLDGGTTSIELARAIAKSPLTVTIVTNSILVSSCFCGISRTKVIQIGGTLNALSGCVTGAEAESAAKDYFIDMGFFTTLGYVPGEGTYESSSDTFRVKLAFSKRCSQVILLLDHSKFGQRALNRVFADSDITKLVTDRAAYDLKDPRLLVVQ